MTKAYMAAAILWDNEEMYNKAVDFIFMPMITEQ